MSDTNISLSLNPAQVSMVRQALRAEEERMVKQGYAGLAKLAHETRNFIADALIDKQMSMV